MKYTESLEFLTNLTKFGINFGLGRIKHLLGLLGNPHHFLRVIHVGGTNGKGSTAMMIARVLEEAGYSTGLFTSPHLDSYTERFLINRQPISQEKFSALVTRLKPLLEKMVEDGQEHPTEFEVCTALALLYFFEEKVDFVVLEVGMGGLIDSTNIVPYPLVSTITNVAMDHMDYLGNSIKEIAEIKSGIIKNKGFAVTAAQGEALNVIEEKCQKENARLLKVGTDISWKLTEATPKGNKCSLTTPWQSYPDITIPLAGQYQVINAAIALGVLEILRNFYGIRITPEIIKEGLAKVFWPARLEILNEHPLVIVDVTHNHDGAIVLSKALSGVFHYRKLILVMGMLGDKEREKAIGELAPLADTVVITRPNSPRAGDWEMLAAEALRYTPRVKLIENILEAVEAGLNEAGPEDMVCVTGSFYMVADARAYLRKRFSAKNIQGGHVS